MTMTSYIQEDLAARIRSGGRLPRKLTLRGLSEHYRVSITPVRLAIEALIEQDLVQRDGQGRLAIVPQPKTAPSNQRVRRPEPPRDVFDQIASDLMRRSLAGDAVYLREEAAAKRYGASRTVVRQAFSRLAGQGLLEHIPRRGWKLRPFKRDDLVAFLQVREVLELLALELAWDKLDPADIQKMLDGNTLPTKGEPIIDEAFHAYIVERSGNRYIADFFARHGHYYQVLFGWEAQHRRSAADTCRQHRKLLKAVLDEDFDKARTTLSDHVRYKHPILEQDDLLDWLRKHDIRL